MIIVEDSFTATFDGRVIDAAAAVLTQAGLIVYRLPARPNGKVLHVLGLRERFARIARARVAECARLTDLGVRLVGLDAATALMFEQEYAEFVPSAVRVVGIETLLVAEDALRTLKGTGIGAVDSLEYRLLSHCTEQALRPEAAGTWISLLHGLGIAARPVKTGCCGMAGLFGHEDKNAALSKRLFELSWRDAIGDDGETVLATGFSCRCQTKRLAGFRPRHPVELIADHLRGRLPT